jgi:hypothetical protein
MKKSIFVSFVVCLVAVLICAFSYVSLDENLILIRNENSEVPCVLIKYFNEPFAMVIGICNTKNIEGINDVNDL